jgi:D-serine deaminase-like pyridoxal phosphate-dependent protein
MSVVTGGGTGTCAMDLASGVFTEIQAGSYALMDVEYGACEAPLGGDWPFRPALFLAATVVSDRHRSHVVVDAGLKALSSDGPFAKVAAGAPSGSLYRPMGDEHGAIFHPKAAARLKEARGPLEFAALIDRLDAELDHQSDAPALGDVVWLQPGHCDPTINLHDALHVMDAEGGLVRWAVDARRAARPR